MTGMTFTVGGAAVKPTHYKIVQHFMGHQEMELETFTQSYYLRERAKVVVTGQDVAHPCFLGWVEHADWPRDIRSFWGSSPEYPRCHPNKPRRYVCCSHSKDLELRYPVKRIYKVGEDLADIVNDTPASQGLLFQANALSPDAWSWDGVDIVYSLLNSGGDRANNDVYLGTTLLTLGSYPPGPNEYTHDYGLLSVGTPGQNPNYYPCYINNLKDTYIRRDAVASQALGGQVTADRGNIYSVLMRLFRTSAMEFEFVNKADGYQWLMYAQHCARGFGWGSEVATFNADIPDVYDWAWITLDSAEYGFDSISVKGQDAYTENTYCSIGGGGVRWKEYVAYDSSIDPLVIHDVSSFEASHRLNEKALVLWAPENHYILPGDWVSFTDDGFTYDPFRVFEKTLEDDVMKLVCYYGATDYY